MDAIVAGQLHPTKDQPTRAASAAHREPSDGAISKRARWGARIVSGIPAAFLLFDAALKLAKPPMVVEGTVKLGYPAQVILPLGVVLLLATVVYLVPRTAVLGAVLLTGYLGGAIATHVRVGDPLASHVLFPAYVAVLLWGGLWLRDARVRSVFSLAAKRAA
jgi:DoxX-like family